MEEKQKLIVVWVILVVLLLGGLVLASEVGHLSLKKDLGVGDVTKLLTTFFVLALFVERTLEVFITAWRGKGTANRENQLLTAKQVLVENPKEPVRQTRVEEKTEWLADYKCETQAIALRSGLVLGILIAAVGVRSFNTFVEVPTLIDPTKIWSNIQFGAFNVLDALISGGIIGGGSDAIHKMMNVVIEFFDATAKKLKNP